MIAEVPLLMILADGEGNARLIQIGILLLFSLAGAIFSARKSGEQSEEEGDGDEARPAGRSSDTPKEISARPEPVRGLPTDPEVRPTRVPPPEAPRPKQPPAPVRPAPPPVPTPASERDRGSRSTDRPRREQTPRRARPAQPPTAAAPRPVPAKRPVGGTGDLSGSDFRRLLRDRRSARQAILLREILGPPVGLRDDAALPGD